MRANVRFLLVFVLVMLVVTACGGKEPAAEPTQAQQVARPTAETKPTDAPTQPPAPTAEPTSAAINTLADAKRAVVQIEAQGTFIDPEVGLQVNAAGRGSGFIIDPSGLVVTNNHVVTGAALIRVWVGGESEPRNARLVAVSECSDLALIDLEGDGYPFLEWYSGAIDVGLDINVLGFPLGDPEYTLNRGVVSKAKTSGDTGWASVEAVLEYDATTNPGNSGGPVVDPNGKVVAVHYAGSGSTRQAFGIARDAATTVLDQLKKGVDVNSIGVNGQAVADPDSGLYGIWVSSVKSGSPADKAGIDGGDIIYSLEGLVLSTDGTMKDYCDILKSHNASDVLTMEVIRFSTGEFLEGQLNGRELEVTGYFGDTNTGSTDVTDPGSADPGAGGGDTGNTEPAVSGDVLYYTDFTDDADNSYWYHFSIPDVDTSDVEWTDAYNLFVQVNESDTTTYVFYDYYFDYADVQIDASVETVAGPNDNNISLICRATEDGWYEFSMGSGGYYYIWKYDGEFTLLKDGGSSAINLQKAANVISATCIGNELSFYVNNTFAGSVRDNTFRDGGQAGVSVSTFDIEGAGVEFIEFAVSLP